MKREHCDLILLNGKIVTVDEDFSIAEAVAVGGGKFIQTGSNEEILALAEPQTERLDLEGKTVLPGIIDAHPHAVTAAIRGNTWVSLAGLTSIEKIKARIAEEVRKAPPGAWIVTSPLGDPPYYFNMPEGLEEGRWPTRWDLDEVSPDNPVYIFAPNCRMPYAAILNSQGLGRMGVTREIPSEHEGIKFVKDPESGDVNGQLYGMQTIYNFSPFFHRLMSLLPQPTREERVKALADGMRERNAAGMTTIFEGHYIRPEFMAPCMELWSGKDLTMRICFAYEIDISKPINELEAYMKGLVHARGEGFGDDMIKICGVTVSLDGAISHGLALMHEPYLDPYGDRTTGKQLVPTEKFKEIALIAARNDLRFNVCICGGDKAADITLDVFEEVNHEIEITDRHWVIQHFNFPGQEHIDRCRTLGIHVSVCTNFEWGFGKEVYLDRFGKDFAGGVLPLRRWLDAGVLIAQSTDYGPYEPMFTLWQSLKRVHGLTGESHAGPDQEITREEALRIYTINGARFLFWEDKLGSIEAGKLADLVVLDRDILTCDLDAIKDTLVFMTMVGGEVVYRR